MDVDLNVTEVRRRLLSLLEDLPEEGIVITRRGEPLARLTPVPSPRKGRFVKGPFIKSKGKPGPLCPTTETPYDLIFD